MELTKEDIESVGFKKRIKNEWIGYNDYIIDIKASYPYHMRATLHIDRFDNKYHKIIIHKYLNNETDRIESNLDMGESETIYKGLINTKEDLENLLIQLDIK